MKDAAIHRAPSSRPMTQTESTAATDDTARVIAPPPLIYAAGLLSGLGLEALLPSAGFPRRSARPAGGALLGAGLGLAAWFVATFRRAQTPVDTRKPTSALVTTGPYRLSRNPGYLSLTLVYSGLSLLAAAPWALLSLLPTLVVVQRGVIAREERYLERRFGDDYLRYKQRTRRWL